MIRLSPVFTIAKKELREIARDRRTLLLMVGLPLLVYPLMIVGMSKLQESQNEAQEARRSIVAVWGAAPELLERVLRTDAPLSIRPGFGLSADVRRVLEQGPVAPEPETGASRGAARRNRQREGVLREPENPVLRAARALIGSRAADAVVVAWPGFERALAAEDAGKVTVYFDSVREESTTALGRLDKAVESYRRQAVNERQASRGLASGFSSVLELSRRDVAPPARQAGRVLGSFLPFLLISLSLFGGFYPAVDLTAGEKERGTLQTLLCAPLQAIEIVTGKFLAVWAVAFGTALVNVISLGFTMARLLRSADIAVPFSAYALTATMLVPVTLTTAALFIAVAVFARDFKDGQNFLTPVYMLLVIPAGATMLPGVELNAWTAFVPVVNIALLVKALLIGEWRGELVFLVLLSSAAFAVLSMLLAVRVFEREQVLLGGRESARRLFGLERRHGGRPSPAVAVTTFAVVLVLAFYGSLFLETHGILVQLLTTQYLFFLAPAMVAVLALGFSPRLTFRLRLPGWRGLAGSVLLGVAAWTVVSAAVVLLAPPPDSLVKSMQRLLMLGDRPMPLWVVLLAVALTPAICEELFFRGLVMSGLERLGRVTAVSLSALLFALAHASIYRLLPTMLLGLVLGYAAWKTGSILCSMIIHALNNGLLATFTVMPGAARALGVDRGTTIPTRVVVVGALVTAVGLWLVHRAAGTEDRRPLPVGVPRA